MKNDNFRFAEPCNVPGVTCYLLMLRHFSRARCAAQ